MMRLSRRMTTFRLTVILLRHRTDLSPLSPVNSASLFMLFTLYTFFSNLIREVWTMIVAPFIMVMIMLWALDVEQTSRGESCRSQGGW